MTDTEQTDKLGQLLEEMRGLNRRIDEGRTKAKDADGGREAAAKDGATDVAAQLTALKAEQSAEIDRAVKAALAEIKTPSMAAAIGQGAPSSETGSRMSRGARTDGHPALKASFRDYEAGELLTGLLDYKGIAVGGLDFARAAEGKAKLDDLGVVWAGVPSLSKATLGATNATGGFVLPNNFVDTLIKPNVQTAVYQDLVTVRSGVNVRGVDQPFRTGAPTRMTFQDWGATKENLNEAYGSYTATLGTMARIYDIGKQYARFSAGSAEQDVVDELGKAAILGENFYLLAGVGTGTVGTGDPSTGVYTALTAVGQVAYTTTFAGASNSTVAGSAASGLVTGLKAMATRSRQPSAAVMDAVTYWQLFAQGSDNAGFWMSELLGAGFTVTNGDDLRFRGIPLRYDANFDTNTATTKRCILGDWKVLKLFRGMEFRIDTSDVANTRWDQNLIGFRGEQEIGVNALAAVAVGAFQLVTGLIP